MSSDSKDVSRETMDALKKYEKLVQKWNPAINLVSKSDLKRLWTRHIQDCIQMNHHIPPGINILDLGSGGGFPGVILAIMSGADRNNRCIHMVESDQRKCAFLRTVSTELGLTTKVSAKRIDDLEPEGAKIVTARALAPLDRLLTWAHSHLEAGGSAYFPKGRSHIEEIQAARKVWNFECTVLNSEVDADSAILHIKNIEAKEQ